MLLLDLVYNYLVIVSGLFSIVSSIVELMEFMKTASAEDILKKTEYWGEDLSFLLPTVQKHLDEIEKNGIRKAMEKVVD